MGSAVNSVLTATGNGLLTLGVLGVIHTGVGGGGNGSANNVTSVTGNVGVGGDVVRVNGNFDIGHMYVVTNNLFAGRRVLRVGTDLGGVGGGRGWGDYPIRGRFTQSFINLAGHQWEDLLYNMGFGATFLVQRVSGDSYSAAHHILWWLNSQTYDSTKEILRSRYEDQRFRSLRIRRGERYFLRYLFSFVYTVLGDKFRHASKDRHRTGGGVLVLLFCRGSGLGSCFFGGGVYK